MRRAVLSLVSLIGLFASAAPLHAGEPPVELIAAPPAVTLDQAVERALSHNPTMAIALDEVHRASALLRQAQAGYIPTLTANGSYTRLDANRILNGKVIAGQDQLAANLTLAVPLIAAHAWTQSRHARDTRETTQLSAADTRRLVAVATARAYLAIVTQRSLLAAAENARDTALAHAEFAHARFAGGIGTRLDEVRAEDEHQTDVAQVAAVRVAVRRAQEALGVMVASDGPLDAAAPPVMAPIPPLDEALSDAASRSDVRASEARERAARRVVKDAWADYMPYLYGVFEPFYQNPPTLVQPLSGWQAGLILSLPIYDGGLRYGQQRERQALLGEASSAREGTLRQARADVRAAFEEMHGADESLAAARKAAALTHQALDLANLAYKAGAATNLEVTDAERSARDADVQVALAEDSAREARLDLLSSTGRFP